MTLMARELYHRINLGCGSVSGELEEKMVEEEGLRVIVTNELWKCFLQNILRRLQFFRKFPHVQLSLGKDFFRLCVSQQFHNPLSWMFFLVMLIQDKRSAVKPLRLSSKPQKGPEPLEKPLLQTTRKTPQTQSLSPNWLRRLSLMCCLTQTTKR